MTTQKTKQLSCDELSVLCWQMALLTKAGYSAAESVSMLRQDAPSAASKRMLDKMHDLLEDHVSLPDAMGQSGGFPDYAIDMVRIGQVSGRLEQV